MNPAAGARGFVLGYDPGGNHAHGLAILEVMHQGDLWVPHGTAMAADCADVHEVIRRAEAAIGSSPLLACGIDTLTAWCGGPAGWRAADLWLRKTYPQVQGSVASPNSLFGAMSLGGGLLLHWLAQREDKGGLATEAHPKVCYYALRRLVQPWSVKAAGASRREAWEWLASELDVRPPADAIAALSDHRFDALMACLAALRGLNRQWTHDLHEEARASESHPFGRTHYWWPQVQQ